MLYQNNHIHVNIVIDISIMSRRLFVIFFSAFIVQIWKFALNDLYICRYYTYVHCTPCKLKPVKNENKCLHTAEGNVISYYVCTILYNVQLSMYLIFNMILIIFWRDIFPPSTNWVLLPLEQGHGNSKYDLTNRTIPIYLSQFFLN